MIKSVRKLRGGETDRLTQNYWNVRAVVADYNSTVEDMYRVWKEMLPTLTEDEEVYLYWELQFYNQQRNAENIELLRILIRRDYNDRIEKKGVYYGEDKEQENINNA